jgi:hypothetical protein
VPTAGISLPACEGAVDVPEVARQRRAAQRGIIMKTTDLVGMVMALVSGVTVAFASMSALARDTKAPSSAADKIASVEVRGTTLIVHLSSGRVLQGLDLKGATLTLAVAGNRTPQRIRIDAVEPDPLDPSGETLLYRMKLLAAGRSKELCTANARGKRWAFPLQGTWDAEGQRTSETGITLTCAADAQGKCVRFGYAPWKKLPDGTDLAVYHQTCIRLVRADYCGGHGTTRNGMAIDIYDKIGIQPRDKLGDEATGLSFEAAWNTKGAVCVAHTRVPQKMSLARLGKECPRLQAYLGEQNCTEAAAESGALGEALMYNQSR